MPSAILVAGVVLEVFVRQDAPRPQPKVRHIVLEAPWCGQTLADFNADGIPEILVIQVARITENGTREVVSTFWLVQPTSDHRAWQVCDQVVRILEGGYFKITGGEPIMAGDDLVDATQSRWGMSAVLVIPVRDYYRDTGYTFVIVYNTARGKFKWEVAREDLPITSYTFFAGYDNPFTFIRPRPQGPPEDPEE